MDEIGEILRQARIQKNMTIQDVHQITKILPRYLRAIEDGQWDIMPGVVYAKGYLRSYAEAVDVDGDYLIQLFDHLLKNRAIEGIVDYNDNAFSSGAERSIEKGRSMPRGAVWWIAALTAIMVLTFVIFSFVLSSSPNNEEGLSLPKEPVQEQLPSNQPEPPAEHSTEPPVVQPEPIKPAAQLTMTAQSGSSAAYAIVTDKNEFQAVITMTGDRCWFRITADGQKVYEGNMTKGETKTIQAANALEIRMGLPKAVEIKIEDQALPYVDSSSPYVYTIRR